MSYEEDKAKYMMLKAGYPEPWGPWTTKFYEATLENVRHGGLVGMSDGSWAEDMYVQVGDNPWDRELDHSKDEIRAQAMLELQWSMEHGYSSRIENIDPIVRRTYDTRSGKRGLRVSWRRIPAAFRDAGRRLRVKFRIARDKLRGVKNPYARQK